MKRMLDHNHNYLKTEENVRRYLHSLSDSQIQSYYDAIEFTSFPILLVKEYSKRFNKKNQKPIKNDIK
jgi:hypothetical protein